MDEFLEIVGAGRREEAGPALGRRRPKAKAAPKGKGKGKAQQGQGQEQQQRPAVEPAAPEEPHPDLAEFMEIAGPLAYDSFKNSPTM